MTLAEVLVEVWRQVLVEGRPRVEIEGEGHAVGRTRNAGLRVVRFHYAGATAEGIEQNPETKSRWAQLAREGQRVMQFSSANRYFANVCEGKLTRYPAWASLGLPP
jgi:hypothetical protein